MSVLNFFKDLFSSPFSLNSEPPTASQVKTLTKNRITISLCGLLGGFISMYALIKTLSGTEHNILQIILVAGIIVSSASFFCFALLITTVMDHEPQPIHPTMCSELLAFCALHPSIELYRAKVVSQNRTFMQGDYGIMKEGARCLNPKDLQACRTLYEIA